MSTVAEYLTKAKGNKVEAATKLALDLSRGEKKSFHLGYSIGSSLIAVTEHFNLTVSEVALVAERMVNQTTIHYSPIKRPLVIVGMDGGLIQWEVLKPGLGTPRVHELDFDRDGASAEDLREFIDAIQYARNDLMEYDDPEDHEWIESLNESISDIEERVATISHA